MTEYITCPNCKGAKQVKDDKDNLEDCPNCNGKGEVPDWSKDYQPEELECNNCSKKFWIANRFCTTVWKYPLCEDCRNKGIEPPKEARK